MDGPQLLALIGGYLAVWACTAYPNYRIATAVGFTKPRYAFIPILDLVVLAALGRDETDPAWGTGALMVGVSLPSPFLPIIVAVGVWAAICWRRGLTPAWAALAITPVTYVLVPWIVWLRLRHRNREATGAL